MLRKRLSKKTGTLKYGCAMGQMIGGTITVE